MNRSVWAVRYRRLGRDAVFLLLSWPLSLLAFCLAVPLTALGAGTVIIWVGLLVLVIDLSIAGGFANMARLAVARVDGREPVPGGYLISEPGTSARRRLFRRLRDPQRWMDLLWTIVYFPVSLVTWILTVVWLALAVGDDGPRRREGESHRRTRREEHLDDEGAFVSASFEGSRDRGGRRSNRPENKPGAARGGRRTYDGAGTVYRIEVGHRDRVLPGAIVGALANEGGIPGADIGKIDILQSFSLVEIRTPLSEEQLATLGRATFSGRELRIRPDQGPGRGWDDDPRGDGDITHRSDRSRRSGREDRGGNQHDDRRGDRRWESRERRGAERREVRDQHGRVRSGGQRNGFRRNDRRGAGRWEDRSDRGDRRWANRRDDRRPGHGRRW